jgi:hypothetical protein
MRSLFPPRLDQFAIVAGEIEVLLGLLLQPELVGKATQWAGLTG